MKHALLLLGLALAAGGAAAEDPSPAAGAARVFAGIPFVWCPPGQFELGAATTAEETAKRFGGRSEWYAHERPARHGSIATGFWMGQCEITQGQWNAVMGGQSTGTEKLPKVAVSWEEIQAFLERLNQKGEGVFRLPGEVQWEYACRAGASTEFYFGDDAAALDAHAWWAGSTRPAGLTAVQPVGQKKPNAWGLCDMLGNAWEWCADGYQAQPGAPGAAPWSDPGRFRVLRGGSFSSTAAFVRCATRASGEVTRRSATIGFRIVREAQKP